MKMYEKPVVIVDAGMAEGVYAASGTPQIAFSNQKILADWGNSGQISFTADLSKLNLSQLTVIIEFNHNIDRAWGGGSSASVSGSSATFTWYSAPDSADLIVQVGGIDPKSLSISSYSYSNK